MPAVGVQIAFDDHWNVVDPTWTDLGTLPGVFVESWSVDRGRLTELDQTGTGTARIELYDKLGTLDPTNSAGTLYGRIDPMKQASIYLVNPVDATRSGTVFRGFVEDWAVSVDKSERFSKVTIDLVDAFDLLSAFELRPSNAGDAVTSNGDIIYAGGATPQTRIQAVLADVGWPSSLSEIFSGNVTLQGGTYAPNTQALAVIQDAADAEFPGLGVVFVNRQGTLTFHGRMPRFRPDVAEYRISQWQVGDMTAFSSNSTIAVISGLEFHRGKNSIINSALATPHNIGGTSIASNLYEDLSSVGTYGYRTWSAEDLLTEGGIAQNVLDARAETSTFSTYYGQNFHLPTTRINSVTLTTPSPSSLTADRVWRVACQVDLNDMFTFTTFGPGGTQFAAVDYFVEGLHYNAMALGTSHHHVQFTADVSPRANYATATFGTSGSTA